MMNQRKQKDLKPEEPPWWNVWLVGLAVAALFIVTYAAIYGLDWLVKWGVPSENVVVIMAALVAASLPAGFLWNRLTKFKIWEIEIELAQVAVQPTEIAELSNVKTAVAGPSYYDMIINQINQAITQEQKARVMAFDLSGGLPWWSTRLFLMAALAQQFTEIKQFIFLETCAGPDDCFIGGATPEAVQRRLTAKQPDLERAYARSPDRNLPFQIAHGFDEWFREQVLSEEQQQTTMTKHTLRESLGEDFVKDYVDWHDGPPPRWMLRKIINYPLPFVPIVQSGRLRLLVDQQDLEQQLASYVIQPHETRLNTKK